MPSTPVSKAPALGEQIITSTQDNSDKASIDRHQAGVDALNAVIALIEEKVASLGNDTHPTLSDARSILAFCKNRIVHQISLL